ncbi:SWF or SNF family helicase [Streptomyces sp. NPDC047973]|uniref:SWIM zinc finger family protein n=1 Tax=Streptomyces sp. NPDC047973 TaxID=3155383 RepID=UPI003434A3B4
MNAPDGPERTFAALPPAQGRGFSSSWWGRAWLKALEDTALDGQQLKKGRGLAREGRVGATSVRPGRLTAVVHDPDSTSYRTDVLVQELGEDEWDRFLDVASRSSGHVAALLDREMPAHLVEDAAAAGCDLLPGIGDLEPECGCEAWDHCPHTGALCYQVARLLDQDPFVLLLLRGRDERWLVERIQERSAKRAAPGEPVGAPPPQGVRADEAFAARDILPPLPPVPALPEEPGAPPSLDASTEPEQGTDPTALEFLAADSAVRALAMLTDALAPGHELRPPMAELTVAQDAVRLAADGRADTGLAVRLAGAAGRGPGDFGIAVRAWRSGGAPALEVYDEQWLPGDVELARARTQLAAAWDEGEIPEFQVTGNRWTLAGTHAQLRLGRDGRWWPYAREGTLWAPAGPAERDPAAALACVPSTA